MQVSAEAEAGGSRHVAPFAIAPMSPVYVLTSGVFLAIPVIWALLIVDGGELRATAMFMAPLFVLLSAVVWFVLRPTRIEVDEGAVSVVFPVRRIRIAREEITGVSQLQRVEVTERLGRPWRIGAGGLFGTFGFTWTYKRGWMPTYVTTTDDWVLVERRGAPPVLLSVRDPETFVRGLAPSKRPKRH